MNRGVKCYSICEANEIPRGLSLSKALPNCANALEFKAKTNYVLLFHLKYMYTTLRHL